MAWSERLARFAQYLPELQTGLPVPDEYKQEMPGSDADLNAYDVVYYAGHCNAGSKTIAINLPNEMLLEHNINPEYLFVTLLAVVIAPTGMKILGWAPPA